MISMTEIVKTMKLHIQVDNDQKRLLKDLTEQYRKACNHVSLYSFNEHFIMSYLKLVKPLYTTLRTQYGLKSQMAQSVCKTVIARYKTVQAQLQKKPYKILLDKNKDDKMEYMFIPRNLEWLQKPIKFSRPQADLVYNRDYSFITDTNGVPMLSLNTLDKRIKVAYDLPECFKPYFDGSWKLGTGKIVSYKNKWYLHISVSKTVDEGFQNNNCKMVVGIDRGLRFIENHYDDNGLAFFTLGKDILEKRTKFNKVRQQLQSKNTKASKRVLKRLSERENRWMTDINHQLSKTLVEWYGKDTLFVIEDLTNVSFDENNLNKRAKKQRNEVRSWSFYQLGQFLIYKANESGSFVLEVDPKYTSQRCPKCGRIHKENRDHQKHLYICDKCGFTANDDEVASMNLNELGHRYLQGDKKPTFDFEKQLKKKKQKVTVDFLLEDIQW